MEKILLFGGTTEGRILAETLSEHGIDTTVCVATEYGEKLMQKMPHLTIHTGRMDAQEMEYFIVAGAHTQVIDATHPYAVDVSENIRKAAMQTGRRVRRLLRDEAECADHDETDRIRSGNAAYKSFSDNPAGIYVDSAMEAGLFLREKTGTIFLTTGSKELKEFLSTGIDVDRVVLRMLPNPDLLKEVLDLGVGRANLICMQGPFSTRMNEATMEAYHIRYLVTKQSGKVGGFPEKMRACETCGVTPIIIKRPAEIGETMEEILESFDITTTYDKKHPCSKKQDYEKEGLTFDREKSTDCSVQHVTLAGIGMGDTDGMTVSVQKAIQGATLLIGAERMVEAAKETTPRNSKTFVSYHKDDVLAFLNGPGKSEPRVVILLSGDVGFFSAANAYEEILKGENRDITRLPGISSYVALAAKLGVSYEQAACTSLHGRDTAFLMQLAYKGRVFLLTGGKESVSSIANRLCEYGYKEIRMSVGEKLGYETERITTATPEAFLRYEEQGICTVYLEDTMHHHALKYGMSDEAFLRGEVPMTKAEIRHLMIAKLGLSHDSILWDIGAGTGSISVEAATYLTEGEVVAFEKRSDGAALILQNAKRMGFDNIRVIEGSAPDCFPNGEIPTHAVIGGSDGALGEMLDLLYAINPKVTVVVSAVTIETFMILASYRKKGRFKHQELIQVQISKTEPLGSYERPKPMSPIWIARMSDEI